jgi:hypothetical protein
MEKKVRFYSRLENGSRWPSELESEYSKEYGKYGIFTFEEDSPREKSFLSAVAQTGIKVAGRSEWLLTGDDLLRRPFHYLTLKSDKDYPHGEYADDTRLCGGDQNVWCRTGGVQKQKVLVDPKKSQPYDIMLLPEMKDPRIIILTRAVKDLLTSANLSGFRFEPCLIKGQSYQSSEMGFGAPLLSDHGVTHYQLVPLVRTKGPAQLGKILRPPMRCSKCGTVYQYWADRTPAFHEQELNDVDFQCFNEYQTENEGKFRIPGEVFIVSSRFLKVLLDNKTTGIQPFLADPPIKNAVVHLLN